MMQPREDRLSWQAKETEARQDWETNYGSTGLRWDEVKQAYLYGWEAAQRPEFAQSDWDKVEQDLAQHWFQPQTATEEFSWDYIKVVVRAGWQKAKQQLQSQRP